MYIEFCQQHLEYHNSLGCSDYIRECTLCLVTSGYTSANRTAATTKAKRETEHASGLVAALAVIAVAVAVAAGPPSYSSYLRRHKSQFPYPPRESLTKPPIL